MPRANRCNIAGQQPTTLLDVACCFHLHALLLVVAQSLKEFKILSQHLPTFLLFRDRRNVVGATMLDPFPQLFKHLETLLGPRTRITHGLQSLKGCILPTMHCGFEHCRELFAHHSPTRSQQLPTLSGEQYWELLRSFARSFCAISYGNSKLIRVRSRWLDIGQVRF